MPSQDVLAYLTAVNPGDVVTATAVGSAVMDLTVARDLGAGAPLFVVAQVMAAFTDAGSDSTVQVELETSADNVTFTALAQILGTFAALSAVGTVLQAALGIGKINARYLRCHFTVANGDLTTGKIVVFLTDAPQSVVAYPVGTSIL